PQWRCAQARDQPRSEGKRGRTAEPGRRARRCGETRIGRPRVRSNMMASASLRGRASFDSDLFERRRFRIRDRDAYIHESEHAEAKRDDDPSNGRQKGTVATEPNRAEYDRRRSPEEQNAEHAISVFHLVHDCLRCTERGKAKSRRIRSATIL